MAHCVQLLFVLWIQFEYRGVRTLPGSLKVWAELDWFGLLWIRIIEIFISFLDLDPVEEFGYNLPFKNMLDLIVCTLQTPSLLGFACKAEGIASSGICKVIEFCRGRLN
jgi:hypothetical protein